MITKLEISKKTIQSKKDCFGGLQLTLKDGSEIMIDPDYFKQLKIDMYRHQDRINQMCKVRNKNNITLTPAYGRDYKNRQDVLNDFDAGKDFILNDMTSQYDGKLCSQRDFPDGTEVKLRYSKLEKVFFATCQAEKGVPA